MEAIVCGVEDGASHAMWPELFDDASSRVSRQLFEPVPLVLRGLASDKDDPGMPVSG